MTEKRAKFHLDELVPVEFTKTVNISTPYYFPPWDVEVVTIERKEFVELRRGDKAMMSWLLNTKTYSTIASTVINELIQLQVQATRKDLAADESTSAAASKYRRKKSVQAAKELQESRGEDTLVSVTLPQFSTAEGEIMPEVETVMPMDMAPTAAMIALDKKVFQWVFVRAHSIDLPSKRNYVKAAASAGDDTKEGDDAKKGEAAETRGFPKRRRKLRPVSEAGLDTSGSD